MLIQPPIITKQLQRKKSHINGEKIPEQSRAGTLFFLSGLVCLLLGMLFGTLGSVQYLIPDFLIQHVPFYKTRPLHVTLVISWIFQGAAGSIYAFLPTVSGRPLFSEKMARLHWMLFVITGAVILICYTLGNFGGREYLEYPYWLAVPVALSWGLIIYNYFKTVKGNRNTFPVYIWMWATGIIAFQFTYLESYLWLFDTVQGNTIRDITIQWKANGAMVGAWNQMIYGTAFYLMEKIGGDKNTSHSRITFFFYFLGLTNLLFNWGHHTYIVPSAPWIKQIAFIISMTELLILGNIIRNWRKSVTETQRNFHFIPYRLIVASDVWIFLNLTLAILISIPALNFFTHGTHITVAHAMGATIGINTLILLASAYYLALGDQIQAKEFSRIRLFNTGYWVTNISLLIFWISLLGAGIIKALQKDHPFSIDPYGKYLQRSLLWFEAFSVSGFFMLVGISILSAPLIALFARRSLPERVAGVDNKPDHNR